jgi:hypothetical protein
MINAPRYSTAAPRRREKRGNILAGLWLPDLRCARPRPAGKHLNDNFAVAPKLWPGKN